MALGIDSALESRGLSGELATAVGLSVGAAVSLGFSRFAYALLLPPMREALDWNYVQAGGLNTANAIGYLVGSASAAWFSRRLGIKMAFLLSLVISGLALLGSGFVSDYGALSALRGLGGASTAILFIIGASLASAINPQAAPGRSALFVATYITGVGGGIVISGLVVPAILASSGIQGWQSGWIWMGIISLIFTLPAIGATRAIPRQSNRDSSSLPLSEARFLAPTILSYGLYGAGYVSYMTFIIVLLQRNGDGLAVTAAFWVVLGAASVAGTLVWGKLLSRIRDAQGLSIVSIVLLLGTMPVLIWPALPAAFVSALIFGGTFMAGPSAVATQARKLCQAHHCTAAIAVLTISFAIGQSIGPILSGYISDLTGSISAGLWIAPILLVLGAACAPFQHTR